MCGRGAPTTGDCGRRAMLLSPRIAPRSASQCAAQKNSPRRRGRAQGSQAGLRELSGTRAMQSAGTVLVAQAILPVPQVARSAASEMRGSDGGVGLTLSRGTACRARRKNLALSSHLQRLTIRGRRLVAHCAMVGAWLLLGRSGTACRAPTGKMRKCDKERCREMRQARSRCVVKLAQARLPVLLKGYCLS
jgi:hypothetical protein